MESGCCPDYIEANLSEGSNQRGATPNTRAEPIREDHGYGIRGHLE